MIGRETGIKKLAEQISGNERFLFHHPGLFKKIWLFIRYQGDWKDYNRPILVDKKYGQIVELEPDEMELMSVLEELIDADQSNNPTEYSSRSENARTALFSAISDCRRGQCEQLDSFFNKEQDELLAWYLEN